MSANSCPSIPGVPSQLDAPSTRQRHWRAGAHALTRGLTQDEVLDSSPTLKPPVLVQNSASTCDELADSAKGRRQTMNGRAWLRPVLLTIHFALLMAAFFIMLSFQLGLHRLGDYSSHLLDRLQQLPQPAPYYNFYNSDVFNPFLQVQDIIKNVGALADWDYAGTALWIFPSWLLMAVVILTQAPSGFLPLLYGALSMALYSFAGGAILATADNLRTVAGAWAVALALFVAGWTVVLFREAPLSPWFYVSIVGIHNGAVLATLAAAALFLSLISGRSGFWRVFGMAALVFAASLSDLLLIVWFVIPACIVGLLHSWATRRFRGATVAGLIGAVALVAWAIERELPAYPVRVDYLSYWTTHPGPMRDFWYTLNMIAAEDAPLLLILVLIVALFARSAMLTISLLRRREHTSGVYMELLLGGSCAAAIIAPLATGYFKGWDWLRYAEFVVIAPLIWVAHHAFRIVPTMKAGQLAWAPVVIVLFSCAAIARPAWNAAQRLAAPRPLQACLEAEGRTAGFGDYWTAQLVIFMSERRIHIVQIQRGGEPYRWSYNKRWFTQRADDGTLPRPDFIVPKNLDTERLRQTFGPPQRVLTCNGEEIWLYEKPLPLPPVGPGRDVGEVRDPQHVRPRRPELALDVIRGANPKHAGAARGVSNLFGAKNEENDCGMQSGQSFQTACCPHGLIPLRQTKAQVISSLAIASPTVGYLARIRLHPPVAPQPPPCFQIFHNSS
jgi:hypothetical protein